VRAAKNDQANETHVTITENNKSDHNGVKCFGSMYENNLGNWFSLLKAKGNLEQPNIIAFNVPNMEMHAPAAIK